MPLFQIIPGIIGIFHGIFRLLFFLVIAEEAVGSIVGYVVEIIDSLFSVDCIGITVYRFLSGHLNEEYRRGKIWRTA